MSLGERDYQSRFRRLLPPCATPGCIARAPLAVGRVPVCLAHWEQVERTAQREATLEHPPFPAFRFVRRRRGFDVWLLHGPSGTNLTAVAGRGPLPLAEARRVAELYAEGAGFLFVDIDRVLGRETLSELMGRGG